MIATIDKFKVCIETVLCSTYDSSLLIVNLMDTENSCVLYELIEKSENHFHLHFIVVNQLYMYILSYMKHGLIQPY